MRFHPKKDKALRQKLTELNKDKKRKDSAKGLISTLRTRSRLNNSNKIVLNCQSLFPKKIYFLTLLQFITLISLLAQNHGLQMTS